MAWAAKGTKPNPDTLEGVFSQPRESFWPFYLRDKGDDSKTVSYDNPSAIPARRKRYIVRDHAVPSTHWPQGNDNAATRTRIRFLPAGTEFTGEIEAHNLHPVEFGALIWALTFGDPSGRQNHLIGRAKSMGHGALRLALEIRPPEIFNMKPPPERPQVPDTWIALFEDWMSATLIKGDALAEGAKYSDHPAILALRAFANPVTGQALKDQLQTGSLDKDFKRWHKTKRNTLLNGGEIDYPFPDPSEVDPD